MRRHENETDEVELELIQRSWYFFFFSEKAKQNMVVVQCTKISTISSIKWMAIASKITLKEFPNTKYRVNFFRLTNQSIYMHISHLSFSIHRHGVTHINFRKKMSFAFD